MPESTAQHRHVLIVDDCPMTRLSLKTTILQSHGEALRLWGEATHGAEALETLQNALQNAKTPLPDVVLMDIGMPILDGVQATAALRRDYPGVHVLMLTSRESEADVLEAFRAGATSYCLKDIPPDQLVAAIHATAQGDSWIEPRIARIVLRTFQPPTPAQSSATTFFTRRELEVLRLITEGKNNTDIAETLVISLNTVKTHIKSIFQKLEVEDRTAAALKALKERII